MLGALSFSGTGQDQITVTTPTPAGVGVAMVPITADQASQDPRLPPTGYIFQVRSVVLQQDYNQHLWATVLPHFITGNPTVTFAPNQNTMQVTINAFLQDPTTGNLTLLALQQTNGNPLTYTLKFPSNPTSPDNLRGQTILFQIRPVPGKPLGNGVYTLTMTVPTPDATPYIARESSWQLSAPSAASLDGGSLYGTIPITDLVQDQFGHAEIMSQFTTADPTVQAFHFWAINPGPVVVKTAPASGNPGVNTWIKVYQAHYKADGFVDYLQEIDGVADNNDWYPADRSAILSQVYVNNFAALQYTAANFAGTARDFYKTGGGEYYVVVKNAEGSVGQYKLVVDTASMPLSGNPAPGNPQIPEVAELSPNSNFGISSGTSSVTLTPQGGLVQYFPIQVPAYHTGPLHVSGSPVFEELALFDAQGTALDESYSGTFDFALADGPQMVYLRARTVFVPTLTVSISVSPPSLLYPSRPPASALLSTNPQGDGTVSGTLAQQGAVQAYSFYAGPGPLKVSVTPDSPGDLALSWAVYSGTYLVTYSTTTLLGFNFIGLNNSDRSTTQETLLLPDIRQPRSSPQYDYLDADLDPQSPELVTVVVQADSTPTGAGGFSVSVQPENTVPQRNLETGGPFSVNYDSQSVLPMAVNRMVNSGSSVLAPLADLSIDPRNGASPSVSTAGQWLRLIVPDGIAGQVSLRVSVPLDAQLHQVHYDVYRQAYDSSGNFAGALIGSDQRYVFGAPGLSPAVAVFSLPVTGGSANLIRIGDELNSATSVTVSVSANFPKTGYARPDAIIPIFNQSLSYVSRATFAQDGSLTPQFPVGLGSTLSPAGVTNLFVSEFWVGSGGTSHFDVQVNSTSVVYPNIALYRFGGVQSDAGSGNTDEKLQLLDYIDYADKNDSVNYQFDTFTDPGAYALVVTALPTSSSIEVSAQGSLPPFPVQEIVLDPSHGESNVGSLFLVSTTGASGPPLPSTGSSFGTEYRTSFYHVVAPAGNQDGVRAIANTLAVSGVSAQLSVWDKSAGGYQLIDDKYIGPTSYQTQETSPPPQAAPNASPGQDFWISLDRQKLDGNVRIGAHFSVPESGTPDLKVTSMTMTPATGQTRVQVSVSNAGFAFADFTNSWWVFNLANFDAQHQPAIAPVSEDALGPGGSTTHVTLWVPDSPQDTVEYIVNRNKRAGLADDVWRTLLQAGAAVEPTTGEHLYNIDEISYTNDYQTQQLPDTRPTVMATLGTPAVNGSQDPNVWGRYIAGIPGVRSDINVAATSGPAGLYQITIERPNYGQYGGGEGTFNYSAAGGSASVSLAQYDFGNLASTDGKDPNIFQATAIDQFGLKSLPITRTIQVVPMPSWLGSEALPTQSIDSSVTYDQSKYQYTLISHAVVLDLHSTSLNDFFGTTVPLIGQLDSELLFEITTSVTVGLNPKPAGVQFISPSNQDHLLVRVLGIKLFDQTFAGESPTANGQFDVPDSAVFHLSVSEQNLLDPATLQATADKFTLHIHDLPLRVNGEGGSEKVTLFELGVPGVASIGVELELKTEVDLEGAISFGLDKNGEIGLLSPTFLGVKAQASATLSGSVNVLGFDAAGLEGVISASLELDYGLNSRVGLGNFVKIADFASNSTQNVTLDLNGSVDAKVGPFKVWSQQIVDVKETSTTNGDVQITDPSGSVTEQTMAGNAPVGSLALAPGAELVIDPAGGAALYTQVVDVGSGSTFLGNLAFSIRQQGVWSTLTTLPENATSVSNPALALTHDQPGTPAVAVYNAVDSADPAGLTVNQYLKGQAVRSRYFNGTSWGSEQTLAAAGGYNSAPVVSYNASGKGLAAWTHNTNANPVDSNGNFDRSSNEIEAAVWDPVQHAWLPPATLTNNAISDSQPAVYADPSGKLYLVWLEDTSSGNQVMYSLYSSGAWSAPAVLAMLGLTRGGSVSELAIGGEILGQTLDVLVAYNRALADGSVEKTLYNRPSTVAGFGQPANVEVVASNADFSFLKTVETSAGLLAYWLQSDGQTSEVFASTLNATTSVWSTPVRLTNDNTAPTVDSAPAGTNLPMYPSVALDTNGNYAVVYDNEAAPGATVTSTNTDQAIGIPVNGNVGTNSEPVLPELTFSQPMTFPYRQPADANGSGIENGAVSGSSVSSQAQIVNIGLAADRVQLEFYDGVPGQEGAVFLGSQIISLAPGQSYDITQPFTVLPGAKTYSIRAMSLETAEIGGQTTHVTSATLVGETQLAVSNVTISDPQAHVGETVTVTAEIDNVSDQPVGPFTVAFYQGDPNFAAIAPPGLQPLSTTTVAGLAGAPAGAWSTATSLPAARGTLGAATGRDGRIYAIGGIDGGAMNRLDVYDPTTSTWSTGAPMPTGREDLAVVAGPDGRIYAIGGYNGSRDVATVEAYNPDANFWYPVASMPTARDGLAAVTGADGRIYAIGGSSNGQNRLTTVEAYDPASDTWSTVANMPTARYGLTAVTGPDGRIYAIGGGVFLSAYQQTVEVYDPASNTWTTAASMPTAREELAAVVGRDGRIYAIGGYNGQYLTTVEAYDPASDTWTTAASMPTARDGLAAVAGADNRIYAIGGFSSTGPVANVDVLDYGSTEVTFPWTVPADGGNFTLTVRADSAQVIPQVSRAPDDGHVTISVLADPALVPTLDNNLRSVPPVGASVLNYSGVNNVQVTATVSNLGTAAAANVPVAVLWSLNGGPFQQVATSVVTLPAFTHLRDEGFVFPPPNQTVTFLAPGLAGDNTYLVVLDPGNTLPDADRSNNGAQTSLHIMGFPDLTFVGPLKLEGAGNTAQLATVIADQGIAGAQGVQVAAYALPSDAPQDWFDVTHSGLLLGQAILGQIAPLSQAPLTIPVDLTGVPYGDDIFVVIDPNQLILMPHHLSSLAAVSGGVIGFPTPTGNGGPKGIAAGPDGRIWFTEATANKIGAIDPITYASVDFTIPTPNSGAVAITAGPDGNLWFTENLANRIGEINPSTGTITEFAVPTQNSGPLGITTGPDGRLWFTENAANRIGALDAATHVFQEFFIPTENSAPAGITAGPDGNLWFTEFLAGQVGRINPHTDAIRDFPLGGSDEESPPGPIGITAGPDGKLWFTENLANQIGAMDPYTQAVSEYPIATPNSAPLNITVGPDGHLWFTELSGNKIGAIDPNTHAQSEFVVPRDGSAPLNLTEGADGNVWFTENAANQIGEKVWARAVSALFGNNQYAPVGSPFGTLLEAQVTDLLGNPVGGATITFNESDGAAGAGGTFAGGTRTASATSNAQGLAIATVLTANSIAAPFSVSAAVGTLSTVFYLNNQSGPGTQLALSGLPTVLSAGQPFTFQVLVEDKSGNLATGDTSQVAITLSGPGPLTSGSTTVPVSNGVAVFTGMAIQAAGTYSVFLADGTLTSPAAALTVLAAPPASILPQASTTPQSVPVGAAYKPLAVLVTDAYGNPVAGAAVMFTAPASGPGGTFANGAGNDTETTNASGIAVSQTFTANDSAGSFLVMAGTGAVGMAAFNLKNNPGNAAVMVPLTGMQSAIVGSAFTPLQVLVSDLFGNPVAGGGVSFTVLAGGNGAGGAFAGTATVTTNAAGIATAPILMANPIAGAFTVTATLGSISAAFALANLPGTPTAVLPASGTPQNTPIGLGYAGRFQAAVTDASGNPVPNVAVTFTAPATGPSGTFAALAVVTTNALGIATAPPFTANHLLGSFNVTASLSSSVARAVFTLTNTAIPATIQAIAGSNQTTAVNSVYAQALQAKVTDASGSPVAGITVVFELPGPGASLGFAGSASVVTNSAGVATAPAAMANTTTGKFMIDAWVAGVTHPAVYTLTNLAGPPAAIRTFAGTPQSVTVGKMFTTNLQAQVLDSFNHPVVDVSVTFTIVSSTRSAGGTFAGGKTTMMEKTNAAGVATAPALAANKVAGSFSVTAAVNGIVLPATFALTNNAQPPHDPIVGPPQSVAIGQVYAPLQGRVRDAYGNPVGGVLVMFSAPARGPSGTFAGKLTASAITGPDGLATAPPFTANTMAGSFLVTVSVQGVTPSTINLTNLAGPAAKLVPLPDASRTAPKNGFFAGPQVQVTDAYGNLLSGVMVTFTVQANRSGAGAAFGNAQTTAIVSTSHNGVASAPKLHANRNSGTVTVQASTDGNSDDVDFTLTIV